MDADVPILSEQEDRALRRMELLNAVRTNSRPRWFEYCGLAIYVIGSLWWSYRCIDDIISGPRRVAGFIWLSVLIFNGMLTYWRWVVAPMHRRIDALTKLVEEEIRNRR